MKKNINELDRIMTDGNRWKFDGNFYITSVSAGKHQRTWPHNDWLKLMEIWWKFLHLFIKCRKASTNLTDGNRWKFDGIFINYNWNCLLFDQWNRWKLMVIWCYMYTWPRKNNVNSIEPFTNIIYNLTGKQC